MSMIRRWWPLPIAIAVVVALQQITYACRWEVGGHAAEHLVSGSFVFMASVVAGALLWLEPRARRSPIVVLGLALWLGAGVAIAIGNARVLDALIDSGQAFTSTDALLNSPAVNDAHDLANIAPLYAVAAAMMVTFGLFRAGVASSRLAIIAGVLNVLIPYFIVPGFGLVVIAIGRCIARERSARLPEVVRA